MNKQINTLICLAFIAILTTSCGMPILGKHVETKSGARAYSTTDSTFAPYVAQFEASAKVEMNDPNFRVGDIPINFDIPEDNNFQAVCYQYSNNSREIIVRKDWWQYASDSDKESIIFHELGHCRLNREHDDSTEVINGHSVKLSMMNHVIVTGDYYSQHRGGYVDELFTQNKNSVVTSYTTAP